MIFEITRHRTGSISRSPRRFNSSVTRLATIAFQTDPGATVTAHFRTDPK
jgi:hypothetical protein